MSYELIFHPDALDEWCKLDKAVREQFKKKLAERMENPRVPASQLSGHKDRYKIKLRSVGYRLIYEVRDAELIVLVVAVGKREHNSAYKAAAKRELRSTWVEDSVGAGPVPAPIPMKKPTP